MTEFKLIQVSTTGPVGLVVIHRPEKLNAINEDVLTELQGAIEHLTAQAVRAVVLTGAGEKAFVAGADIAAMAEMSSAQAEAFARRGHSLGERMIEAPFPILAAVNGFALGGGCELALACDLIYASDKARFGLPEVTLGVIPGFGGTQRLARRVGVGKAREMVFTGAPIDAAEALAIGLADRVFPHDALRDEAMAAAARIAANAPRAVAYAKRARHAGENVPLGVARELETQAFGLCFATEDQKTGMRTFVANPKAARTFAGR
ncbi:MAG: enoyl-CoA hydratase-related protein [Polyangiales bacterium]